MSAQTYVVTKIRFSGARSTYHATKSQRVQNDGCWFVTPSAYAQYDLFYSSTCIFQGTLSSHAMPAGQDVLVVAEEAQIGWLSSIFQASWSTINNDKVTSGGKLRFSDRTTRFASATIQALPIHSQPAPHGLRRSHSARGRCRKTKRQRFFAPWDRLAGTCRP